ncbi:hypothetical protein NOF04DRAFT_15045 [Fusarium oxysporum II5]|uniref:Uncharacterized protein n=2 Tax=Fusarium oxysporum species complex TaxID=171631 RepID=X0LD26_FUSO5|nr:uncharacterized protein FOIG_03438 [Fusarium odoratissimum NRRL 54006]EXM06735.1 hypothetical protein FOIG_03438 [Fusarium odoratissimum NRRL 54006]KAK2132778.1 hypothetical protein NOF04DRAFT_15045 [Fusarium oxysporum II5]TXC07171.1 hypothetical protein FocTR4_00002932 [Fusarium oxysporum f. sp. cubense]
MKSSARFDCWLVCFSRQLNSLTALSSSHLPQTCTLPLPCLALPYFYTHTALHCTFLSPTPIQSNPLAPTEKGYLPRVSTTLPDLLGCACWLGACNYRANS